jgi:predicted nucleic acid-binding protein
VATFYADSNVLVKRHVTERGTRWVQTLADPANGHVIITARITLVEVPSAFNLKRRRGDITEFERVTATRDFAAVVMDYQLVEVTAAVVNLARDLLERHPLRGYDVVQLAAALIADTALRAAGFVPLTFLTADCQLLTAAYTEGLTGDTPDNHP